MSSVTDPLGHTITNSFDALGNLVWMRDPLGKVTSFGYNEQGLPVAEHRLFGSGRRLIETISRVATGSVRVYFLR